MTKDSRTVLLMLSLLLMTGIVMIYSSSAIYASGKYGDSLFFVKRHLIYMAAGIMAAVFFMAVPVNALRDNARKILLAFIVILLLVLIPGIGSQIGGARRWIRFGGFGFQPSEGAKLVLIMYLADLLSRKRYMIKDLRYGFIPPLSVIAFFSGLVLLEPDMGTAVLMLFVGVMMLFMSGASIRHLAFITAGMVPFLIGAVIMEPYRMRRLVAFFDPWKDAKGSGFQLIQSFIALGSGGLFGVGLGASRQKLFYLPESHTDFIFSIIGEELGFLGTSSVLIIFGALLWFSFRISFRLKDRFMSYIVFGISIMIAFEVMVNIGVSSGMLPTKGLPLPFISYGGSSLVCHLAAMGLLFNIAREAD